MPAKEIKELRQAGKLDEALSIAKGELEEAMSPLMIADAYTGEQINHPADLTWPKRNLSWVFYEYLKKFNSPEHFDSFISWLNEIKNLQLPKEEKMLFEQLTWLVGKFAFKLSNDNPVDFHKGIRLFEAIESFHFPMPFEGYSFLFKALHKLLKETDRYLEFADWWDFENFMPEDFKTEKMPNGKEVMSIAEQGYIAYSKHLLPKTAQVNNSNLDLVEESKRNSATIFTNKGIKVSTVIFDKQKVELFIQELSKVADAYPDMQYPSYYNAKLLLALGDRGNMLESLLPFAKKKRNDFWVWEILSEGFPNDSEKVFACYCKALSCKSPEEMLVSLRQKMAGLLIAKKLYNEAKTEIDLLVHARTEHGFRIPNEVVSWQTAEWYKNAKTSKSNFGFYKTYISIAEGILFSDVPEELIIVDFVNSDKKMLNFIVSEKKFGYLKYDRFLSDVKVGDILKVRFQGGSNEGMHQIYTAIKVNDVDFRGQFIKEVSGSVKVPNGKPFGFLEDAFIHPSLVTKLKLIDGMQLKSNAIRSYDKDKRQWRWKLF